MIAQHGQLDLLKGYPLAAALEAAQLAMKAMEQFRTDITGWDKTNLDWSQIKPQLETVAFNLEAKISDVIGYKGCIDRACGSVKCAIRSVQRATRTAKDSCKDMVVETSNGTVPGTIAKIAGDLVPIDE